MAFNGIDVSKWQGVIDWSRVKTDFCIIQAGYGRTSSQRDLQFETNYTGCKANGIPCGAYWYSYATSSADALLEADACLEVIKGKKFEYPIYYDVEENSILSLGKAEVSAIIRAFVQKMESAGYWVGLYMSANALTKYADDDIRREYAVWVANYGVSKPDYSGQYGIWQRSNTGSVDGIEGSVDLDTSYVDYPTEIKSVGLNGYSKDRPEPAYKFVTLTIDGVTYEGTLTEKQDSV